MDDEELEEMRAELEQLREFKRVVTANFDELVCRPPAGYHISDLKLCGRYDVTYDKTK